jgi:eukaryotic-like serine/threonine-protein kinase
LALAALALAGFYFWPRPEPIPDVTRFEIAQPADVAFSDNIALSPDGRKLAYIATASNGAQLWIRSMDSAEARPLAGTERAVGTPIWSPDSRYVAFSGQGKLQKIEASGGATQTLCAAPGAVNGGFWTGDDKILFAINANSGLLQVGASGGEPAPVTTLANDEARHAFPSLLPDGRHFVYARASTATVGGIYLSPLDAKPTDPPKKLLPDISRVVFAPASGPGSNSNGYLLFLRSGTLTAQPFDTRKLELAGAAVPLAERVSSQVTIAAFSGAFSASGNGSLVYRSGGSGGPQQVTWFDREGKPVGTFGDAAPPEMYASAPAVSPDGKRVALTRNDAQAGSTDIWLFEFARGLTTRFTFGPGASTNPVWSPDGSRIVFLVHRGGAWGIYRKAANLVGGEELLYKSPAGILLPTSWSRDGKFLLFQTGGAGVLALPMEGAERKPIPLLSREFNQRGARFSPDGRYMSYVSNESGRDEIYIRTFDPAGGANSPSAGKWQVSRDGAVSAHWRADGGELLYTSPNGTIMSVDVVTAPVFQSGVPKPLFRALSAGGANWDVSADGKRVVLSVPVGANPAAPYTVVLNWTSLLRR